MELLILKEKPQPWKPQGICGEAMIATGTMILLSGHGLSVEAMYEHREPSHPVRAAGRESGGEIPM